MPTEVMHLGAEDRVNQMAKGHLPVHDPDQCQRGKKRHNTLGIIENTRSLVDQHEAKRDERIKHPGHQPVEKNLNCKRQLLRHHWPSPKSERLCRCG